jgi:mannonate dehydratase
MIKIAELFLPYPTRLWQLAKQVGVNHAVGILPYEVPAAGHDGPRDWRQVHGQFSLAETARNEQGEYPWDYGPLSQAKARFAEAGLDLAVIESSPPMERARQGLPGRDEEIEQVGVMLRAMGRLGIGVWCYNFLAQAPWGRTAIDLPTRGGALVTAFNLADAPPLPPSGGPRLTHEGLWENLRYFLERVTPLAEAAGVKLALHPDDPPVPMVGGVPRILTSLEAFDRLFDLAPSPANGVTFCQGNFGLMTPDLPAAIRRFGSRGKIHFVHFRDVRGTPDNFHETFHDDGPTDMLACLRAYREIGFTGLLRPDHVPTLAGESNASPGYAVLGRLHAVGYIRGLAEAVFGREAARGGEMA